MTSLFSSYGDMLVLPSLTAPKEEGGTSKKSRPSTFDDMLLLNVFNGNRHSPLWIQFCTFFVASHPAKITPSLFRRFFEERAVDLVLTASASLKSTLPLTILSCKGDATTDWQVFELFEALACTSSTWRRSEFTSGLFAGTTSSLMTPLNYIRNPSSHVDLC